MTVNLVPPGPNQVTEAEYEPQRAQLGPSSDELMVVRRRRRQIGKAVIAKFGDGKWHPFDQIVEHTGAPADQVEAMLELMRKRSTYDTRCVKKQVGQTFHYRMSPHERTVGVRELTEKLGPLIEGLKAEGKKNYATISISKVAMIAVQFERLMNEWAK